MYGTTGISTAGGTSGFLEWCSTRIFLDESSPSEWPEFCQAGLGPSLSRGGVLWSRSIIPRLGLRFQYFGMSGDSYHPYFLGIFCRQENIF